MYLFPRIAIAKYYRHFLYSFIYPQAFIYFFHNVTIMSNPALNMGVQRSLRDPNFYSFRTIFQSGIARSHGNIF